MNGEILEGEGEQWGEQIVLVWKERNTHENIRRYPRK